MESPRASTSLSRGGSLKGKKGQNQHSKQPSRLQVKQESSDSDSDDESPAATKPTNVVDKSGMDWTEEEQSIVFKTYGLDTMFPTTWTEDAQDIITPIKNPEEPLPTRIADYDKSDPLQIKENIMKRPKGAPKLKNPNVLLVNDKQFDPKVFLTEVHKNTEYRDLEQGLQRLKQAIDDRHEQSKGLVKKHFAKFVSAKSTVDSFYKEMKGKNLISKDDYGIVPFEKAVSALQKDANALYGPVLERRLKAAKIRLTLSVLEQWKFFFNLSSSLSDMVRRGRYDAAVRDYKKGKSLMISSFGSEDQKEKNEKEKDQLNLLPKSYQNVFEKLWEEVERVVSDFREELFRSLSIMSNPIETQEKIIGYLIELDAKRDPVWCYLDTQYNWVLGNLVQVYQSHVQAMKDIVYQMEHGVQETEENFGLDEAKSTTASYDNLASRSQSYNNLGSTESLNINATLSAPNQIADNTKSKLKTDTILPSLPWDLADLKRALLNVTSQSFEKEFGLEIMFRFWKQTLKFVNDLCELLRLHLPLFWRTCKLYMDGKQLRKKHKSNAQKRIRDGQSMMTNIFEIIQTMINYSFFLNHDDDDDEEEESDAEEEEKKFVPYVPKLKELNSFVTTNEEENDFDADAVWQAFQDVAASLEKLPKKQYGINFGAHPLMIVHFATQIMQAFHSCYDEIKPCYTGDEGSAVLESLSATVNTVKERLVNSICDGWISVSKAFFDFEDWSFENETYTPGKQQGDSTNLLKLANKFSKFLVRSLALVIANTEDDHQEKETPNSVHIEKVRISLFESLFALLDGFQWQLARWRDPDGSVTSTYFPGWVPETHHHKLKSVLPDQKSKFGQFVPSECANFVEMAKPKDYKKLDDRHLMILCNLLYLRNGMLHNLAGIFESKFHVDVSLDTQFFAETSDILERIIVFNFAKRQCSTIKNYIQTAVFFSGLDWASLNKPHEIRPYCYHILHHLVYVHALVSEISRSLVPRVMSEIVMFLAQELLMSLRQVDRFNISGMLQATLEVEFLDSSLKNFETPESAALFTNIYETLERAPDPDDKPDPTKLNTNLANVKTFLATAKSSTFTQFRCLGVVTEM